MQNVSHFISNILNQIIQTSLPMELDNKSGLNAEIPSAA